MSFVIEDVLVRHDPSGRRLPVLFDSPHSGTVYPPDFGFICPFPVLRQAEDTHVDALFGAAPEFGATLLCALFPRTYVDVNRAGDDIDPDLLDGSWPTRLRPTGRSAAGQGLIRAICRPGQPLYDGKLTVAEVAARIDRCYRPYHAQVAETIASFVRQFGRSWHVDCHSMPSAGEGGSADFVVGDRDGTTADRGFVDFVVRVLRSRGYAVAINHPYKGVELVARYGDPARGRHSVQLEVNRRLYMNEETLEKHAGFAVVQRDLTGLIRQICAYAEAHTERGAERRAAE